MASTQTLSDSDRRVLARWAADCAERVLPLFEAEPAAVAAVHDALERTRAYGAGDSSAAEEIKLRLVAVKAAKLATTPAGAAAARAVAQASAVAHMGAHALGAAGYAVKACGLANPDDTGVMDQEVQWQLSRLGESERSILRQLPALGADSTGPLGPGLLAGGVVGATIREVQAQVGTASS